VSWGQGWVSVLVCALGEGNELACSCATGPPLCPVSLSLSGLGGVFGMTGMEKGRVVLLRNHAVVATGHTPHSSHSSDQATLAVGGRRGSQRLLDKCMCQHDHAPPIACKLPPRANACANTFNAIVWESQVCGADDGGKADQGPGPFGGLGVQLLLVFGCAAVGSMQGAWRLRRVLLHGSQAQGSRGRPCNKGGK